MQILPKQPQPTLKSSPSLIPPFTCYDFEPLMQKGNELEQFSNRRFMFGSILPSATIEQAAAESEQIWVSKSELEAQKNTGIGTLTPS